MWNLVERLLRLERVQMISLAEQAAIDIQAAIDGTGTLFNLCWGRTEIVFFESHIEVRTLFVCDRYTKSGIGRAVITTLQNNAKRTNRKIRLLTVKPELSSACVRYGFNKVYRHSNDWEWTPT